MKTKWIWVGIVIILLASGLSLYAAAPLDTIKSDINRVLEVVRDQNLARKAKINKIETLYSSMFDEIELAKRSLGRNWNKLNLSQQKEFIDLFRQVLETAYIDKILSYRDEKIEFTKENVLSDTQAEVQTRVLSQGRQIPINYRLIVKNNVWKIYDVVIENVSLVQNYRSQFNSILSKSSPDQLIETLRNRVKAKKA